MLLDQTQRIGTQAAATRRRPFRSTRTYGHAETLRAGGRP